MHGQQNVKKKKECVCILKKTNFTIVYFGADWYSQTTQSYFVHGTDKGFCTLIFAEPNNHLHGIYVLVGLCQV